MLAEWLLADCRYYSLYQESGFLYLLHRVFYFPDVFVFSFETFTYSLDSIATRNTHDSLT